MSSLEMVEYINSIRKAGEAKVEHYNFLKKVPQVLGVGAVKFYCSYKSSQNKSLPLYNFPKREAMLIAMSYSYELQAQVFDAWEATEAALSKAQKPAVALLPNFDDPIAAAKASCTACFLQRKSV
nr:hypothetical protein [uncultured Albidiferax sp.]